MIATSIPGDHPFLCERTRSQMRGVARVWAGFEDKVEVDVISAIPPKTDRVDP
jgi:hypothetical protein